MKKNNKDESSPSKMGPVVAKEDSVQTTLGITAKKLEQHSEWYQQIMIRAELIDYYDVSGCYVIRPWSYYIWSKVQEYLDKLIKDSGVDNCYFPMFVSKKRLEKEKDHLEGFSPEVAWVTKAGNAEMAEPVAIRPTSETVMYPYYSSWIRSHRDLPLKLNAWNNVVRWEFKDPQPFIRTREFLWQEGHCAYATKEEAVAEAKYYQDVYRKTIENMLAIPSIPGIKSKNETFAGAECTYTLESFISETGRGIQTATSHYLGQKFAKMFDVGYLDTNMERQLAWQISWGLSTRTIGIFIMIHSDDKGLVLTPSVAKIQVVVIPVGMGGKNANRDSVVKKVQEVSDQLKSAGIRAVADVASNNTAGWKFSYWELKGVPLRLEIGPKELESDTAVSVMRFNGNKSTIQLSNVTESVKKTMVDIHNSMLEAAKKKFYDSLMTEETWDGFINGINNKKMILSPWCDIPSCEDEVKIKSSQTLKSESTSNAPSMGAKTFCIPYEQPKDVDITTKKCFSCGNQAKVYALWGRSY